MTMSMYSRFFLKLLVHGTGLLSLKLCHWLYLDKIVFKISMLHAFLPHNTLEGSCGIINQNIRVARHWIGLN